jgi:hypothetical protein
MQPKMRTTRLIPLMLAALAACAESPAGGLPLVDLPGQAVAVTPVGERYPSYYSGFEQSARIVVEDAEEWAQVWSRLWNNQHPVPPLPAVDFSREVVVVAAMGTRPNGGYSIRVQAAAVHEGSLTVRVVETSPGSRCVTTQAITTPTDVVRVARSGLPVRFTTATGVLSCR